MRVIQDCTHFLGWEGVWKGEKYGELSREQD